MTDLTKIGLALILFLGAIILGAPSLAKYFSRTFNIAIDGAIGMLVLVLNFVAIMVMVFAILFNNKASTEQIKAIKNVAQDHLDKTEELKKQNRKKEFETSLQVLDTELEHNLSMLKKIENNLNQGSTYFSLNHNLVAFLLYKPSTVEFGGKVLYQTLLATQTRTKSFNFLYSRVETLSVQRQLTEKEVKQIKDKVNQTEYIIALCRTLITKFEQDNNSLLQQQTFKNLEKALELEKRYREKYPDNVYEKLKADVRL